MANVVMRNMSDITSSPDSAVRIPRAMLIGANATPDLLSVGTTDVLPATTTLGVTVEQDGLTDFGAVDTTPQSKVMFNSYKTNSLASYTTYPAWSEFLGQSGNATVDMPYLGAPNFNFKLLGGTKAVKSATSSGDIPGRLTWNTLSVGGGSSGSDQFNPPASITGMVGGSGALATMANTDMHFQSTYNTSFRNGTDLAAGSIPRTFLSSTAGDVIIASKTDGNVSLRPVRDYGDTGSATTFVANRYAPNLHDYHEFITAGFLNQSTKAGTHVILQNKSGQTGAAPGGSDFNYDSKGDVVLSFKTHNTNNSEKESYTIGLEQSTNKFQIKDNSSSVADIELLGDRTKFGYRVNLVNLTTTEINALSSPSAGDFVYNETLAKLCFYNGSAWQKVTSDAM